MPDRISGVRASSTSTLSASSTMANCRPRSSSRPPAPRAIEQAEPHRDRVRPAAEHQPVPEVVEGDFLVAAIRDVAGVGGAPLRRLLAAAHAAHRQAEPLVDRRHLLRIALGQVVVDRDDVHRLAGERRGGRGERRGEGLALAGVHLGDHAAQHRPAADQLDVEMPHAEHPRRGFAHQRERLRGKRKIVEAGALQVRPERGDPGAQLGVGGRGSVARVRGHSRPRCRRGAACRIRRCATGSAARSAAARSGSPEGRRVRGRCCAAYACNGAPETIRR